MSMRVLLALAAIFFACCVAVVSWAQVPPPFPPPTKGVIPFADAVPPLLAVAPDINPMLVPQRGVAIRVACLPGFEGIVPGCGQTPSRQESADAFLERRRNGMICLPDISNPTFRGGCGIQGVLPTSPEQLNSMRAFPPPVPVPQEGEEPEPEP